MILNEDNNYGGSDYEEDHASAVAAAYNDSNGIFINFNIIIIIYIYIYV